MRFSQSLLCGVVTVPLLLVGCSKPAPIPTPSINPSAKAETEAIQRKIEELKKTNPNLPPTAIGTMAIKMVQQEKMAQGNSRP